MERGFLVSAKVKGILPFVFTILFLTKFYILYPEFPISAHGEAIFIPHRSYHLDYMTL